MAFEKLEFTKNWENAADFPAVETSEAQVRKDMQILHDETRYALNSVVEKLNTKKLDEYPSGGTVETLGTDHTTIPTSKAVRDAIVLSGALPNGGGNGQVLRKKSDIDYDYDWDTMQSLITAAGLLKGLGGGAVQAAVPGTDYVPPTDPALLALKRYTWRRRSAAMVEGAVQTVGPSDSYDIKIAPSNALAFCVEYQIGSGYASADWATAVQGDFEQGFVAYVDGTRVTSETYSSIGALQVAIADNIKGNYMLRSGLMWKIPLDAVLKFESQTNSSNETVHMLYCDKMQEVTIQYGEWELLTSDSPNAYPKSGYSGGYVYEYLGSFAQESVPFAARINTGFYWGTGRRDTVTCETGFRPKLFLLYPDAKSQDFLSANLLLYVSGSPWMKRFYGGDGYTSDSDRIAATVTDDSISFAPGYLGGSLDEPGERFRWVAIG